MNYQEFVTRVIDDGIVAAQRDYAEGTPPLNGALTGFDACREASDPASLRVLLTFAREKVREQLIAPLPDTDAYVFAVAFETEIEWVCNCVSALLLNEGHLPIVPTTARAVLKAAEILGVAPLGRPDQVQGWPDSPSAGHPDCLCSFCGRAIGDDEGLILRAWTSERLEIRACPRDACTRRFLEGSYANSTH